MEIPLTAGVTAKRSIASKSIVVLAASGPFEMWTVGLEPIKLQQGDSIPDLGEYIGRDWSFRSDINQTVELGVSALYVRRATDGSVTVTNVPTVGVDDSTPIQTSIQNQPTVTVDDTTPIQASIQNQPTVTIDDATPPKVDVVSLPSLTATVNHSDKLSALADVTLVADTAAQLAAADAKRIELMVKNPSASADSVRLGEAGLDGTAGYELEPGESVILSTSAAVYAISSGTPTLKITSLEIV